MSPCCLSCLEVSYFLWLTRVSPCSQMHLGYHTLRLTIDEWRDRGLNNISIFNTQPKAGQQPKEEDMQDGEIHAENGVNGDSSRKESTKRASDLPEESDREKRRRYD